MSQTIIRISFVLALAAVLKLEAMFPTAYVPPPVARIAK